MSGRKKYTTEYLIKDMNCFKLYCDYLGITMEKQLNINLDNFLKDNAQEILLLIEKQKEKVLSRKN